MQTLRVNVSFSQGEPRCGGGVLLELESKNGSAQEEKVKCEDFGIRGGRVEFKFDERRFRPLRVSVAAVDYWTALFERPRGHLDVRLEPLPRSGPLGWWHEAVNITDSLEYGGRGVKIGVIDTGFGKHDALRHVKNLGAFEGVYLNPAAGFDTHGHGTHVAGIIAARPSRRRDYRGIAPMAAVVTIKVASGSRRLAQSNDRWNQDSVSEAIEYLAAHERVDLINMSFGSRQRSLTVHDAVRDAFDQGVLCLCAAGNDGKDQLRFPAALEETVAVAALGKVGFGPRNGRLMPDEPGKVTEGGFFLAPFSNYGPGVACIAPGVRVISTAPFHPMAYSVMSGTSMAAPAACAALATVLSGDAAYHALPRSAARAIHARNALEKACKTVELSFTYEGKGVPQCPAQSPRPKRLIISSTP